MFPVWRHPCLAGGRFSPKIHSQPCLITFEIARIEEEVSLAPVASAPVAVAPVTGQLSRESQKCRRTDRNTSVKRAGAAQQASALRPVSEYGRCDDRPHLSLCRCGLRAPCLCSSMPDVELMAGWVPARRGPTGTSLAAPGCCHRWVSWTGTQDRQPCPCRGTF